MEALIQFAGRLHPLLLHAPIGLLIGLAALELISRLAKKPLTPFVRAALIWLVALSAAASIASGLILAEEGGYARSTLQLHKYLAIAVGVAALAAALANHFARPRTYGVLLAFALVLLMPAGHIGSTMTHGPRFLTEPFATRPTEPVVVPVDLEPGQSVYTHVIAPILTARCVGCHGSDRDKGGLRLHTPEAITLGGESGPVFVASDPGQSEILKRMLLPLDHDDRMPPRSKPQPAPTEVAAIEAWIADGASFVATRSLASAMALAEHTTTPDALSTDPGPPSAAAIHALREHFVHVEPVAANTNFLVIDASTAMPAISDERLEALLIPLREHVADLSLARTKATDAIMPLLAQFPNLVRLDFSSTSISNIGLANLTEHASLETLLIAQSPNVTDETISILKTIPRLSRVYLWGSGISAPLIAKWRQDQPQLRIDAGDAPLSDPLDATASTDDTSAAIARAVTDALTPINAMCPVSSKPVDRRYAVVHNQRVIAFCCANCLDSFVRDPDRFAQALGP
ncbi:MAG: hypothetical protein KF757_10760 [Phycisphaeraceae bacterium]|nr:hypothetical protein [Phycisphaeraceae bacterium]MCW5764237.1 hypothetical protein [Phycisphaeraceae bacterium]